MITQPNLGLALTIVAALFTSVSTAQTSDKDADRAAILAMQGCYDVSFMYTETFAPEVDYEFAYDYTSAAFEYAHVVQESEDTIMLQHLLIIQQDSMEPYIIKHWRQDWVYNAGYEIRYDKDHKWYRQDLDHADTGGKWTQLVYQVDDSPRYSGTATWLHADGVSRWISKDESPLPRREYSKRTDYNVMARGNHVQIHPWGWVHEQDNDKLIKTDTSTTLLAQEKGYNKYLKRPLDDCQAAIDWWASNHEMWSDVRSAWAGVYEQSAEIQMVDKVDGKRLYEHLFYGETPWDAASIKALIDTYILPVETTHAGTH